MDEIRAELSSAKKRKATVILESGTGISGFQIRGIPLDRSKFRFFSGHKLAIVAVSRFLPADNTRGRLTCHQRAVVLLFLCLWRLGPSIQSFLGVLCRLPVLVHDNPPFLFMPHKN